MTRHHDSTEEKLSNAPVRSTSDVRRLSDNISRERGEGARTMAVFYYSTDEEDITVFG